MIFWYSLTFIMGLITDPSVIFMSDNDKNVFKLLEKDVDEYRLDDYKDDMLFLGDTEIQFRRRNYHGPSRDTLYISQKSIRLESTSPTVVKRFTQLQYDVLENELYKKSLDYKGDWR